MLSRLTKTATSGLSSNLNTFSEAIRVMLSKVALPGTVALTSLPSHGHLRSLATHHQVHTRAIGGELGIPALSSASTPLNYANHDVAQVIRDACEALGRQPGAEEAALVETLKNNWYSSAADIVAMSDEAAAAIGIPLKLKYTIAALLEAPPAALDVEYFAAPTAHTEVAMLDDGNMTDDGDWENLSIEERICPPLDRFGHKIVDIPKATTRSRPEKYALGLHELTPALAAEFEQLLKFGTKKFFGSQSEPIAVVTAEKYAAHLRGMLGWMHTVRDVPLESLSLKALVPSAEREGVSLAFEYVQWMSTVRGVGVRTEMLAWRSILYCAKFVHHSKSLILPGSGEKPYSDLGIVKEIRALITTARKEEKVAPRTSDDAVKWLDWPAYLRMCRELKKECALLKPDGTERSRKDVAWSLQRYLIFRILASVPDRQRTLRELEVGRTLVQEDGRWCIRHGPGDYKTGRAYGERPPLVIAPTIYPELEAFMNTWRKELEPRHNLLFTQANGDPFTDKNLYKMYWVASYRLTGKRFTPHLVRDSCVTFLRGGNASERELEALALYMGHSVEMQRSSYDRRTKGEKVGPAVALLEALNVQAAAAGAAGEA